MKDSNKNNCTFSDWKNWVKNTRERYEDSIKCKTVTLFNLRSKTLIYQNMSYVYGPMIIGINVEASKKRRTLWFLDVTRNNHFEREWHEKTRTWGVMRMEFVEAKLAAKQTDNLAVYDGLSLSEHFIERVIQRNTIKNSAEYAAIIQKIMAGIVRLDTKNLAEDFLSNNLNDICIVLNVGVFYVGLDMLNGSGRMIIKTFIPFNEMSDKKSARFKSALEQSRLKKKTKINSKFAVISAKTESGVHEFYEEFVKDYVISDSYIPPPAVEQSNS